MKHQFPQLFDNIYHLRAETGIILPKPFDTWRLIAEPVMGKIQGIPTLWGVAIATNGITLILQRGEEYLDVHLDNFIPDDIEDVDRLGGNTRTKATSTKPQPDPLFAGFTL